MPTRKGYKQSEEHKSKHIEKIKGDRNGNWKGGIESLNPTKYYREYWIRWAKENPSKKRRFKLLGKGSFSKGEWENLKAQYGFTCPSCIESEPKIVLTIDHIIPLSKGGSNFIENIQPLCMPCNRKKYISIIKFELPGQAR